MENRVFCLRRVNSIKIRKSWNIPKIIIKHWYNPYMMQIWLEYKQLKVQSSCMHFTCINIPKLNLYSSSSMKVIKLTWTLQFNTINGYQRWLLLLHRVKWFILKRSSNMQDSLWSDIKYSMQVCSMIIHKV